MVAPNLMSDLDGRYRGRDQKIHQLVKDNQYTVFSLWDTYRGNHPLFTLIQQERTTQFIRTFLRQFDEGGDLPVWELAACETECMIGYHSVSVISDAYMKGLDGKTKVAGMSYDAKKALNDMHVTANINELGKQTYANNGYLSSSDEPESVSKTLEYAYDDFCIAEMAAALGNDEMAKTYRKRSFSFVNLFDPNTKFMRARRGVEAERLLCSGPGRVGQALEIVHAFNGRSLAKKPFQLLPAVAPVDVVHGPRIGISKATPRFKLEWLAGKQRQQLR